MKRLFPALAGILLFFGGIAISLSFSATLLWGELEARLYTQQSGDKNLKIECPLVMAPWETAEIKTIVTNSLTDKNTKPQVNAFISQPQGQEARLVSETLELSPLESRAMQWTVNGADIIFDRLILVNILQRPYRDLPSHQGACSILVYSLFGLNGVNTLYAVVVSGILASLLGAILSFFWLRPFTGTLKSFAQVSILFFVLSLLGLFASVSRLWGLTMIFDAAALLAFGAGSIEIFFKRTPPYPTESKT
jgi:hypothetical protein